MAWRPDGIVSVYLNTASVQPLCSAGHAAVIKSRLTVKRAEAAGRMATNLETQRMVCLSLPLRGVGERDHLIRRTSDPSLKRQAPVYLSFNYTEQLCPRALFCQQAGRTQPTPHLLSVLTAISFKCAI